AASQTFEALLNISVASSSRPPAGSVCGRTRSPAVNPERVARDCAKLARRGALVKRRPSGARERGAKLPLGNVPPCRVYAQGSTDRPEPAGATRPEERR